MTSQDLVLRSARSEQSWKLSDTDNARFRRAGGAAHGGGGCVWQAAGGARAPRRADGAAGALPVRPYQCALNRVFFETTCLLRLPKHAWLTASERHIHVHGPFVYVSMRKLLFPSGHTGALTALRELFSFGRTKVRQCGWTESVEASVLWPRNACTDYLCTPDCVCPPFEGDICTSMRKLSTPSYHLLKVPPCGTLRSASRARAFAA